MPTLAAAPPPAAVPPPRLVILTLERKDASAARRQALENENEGYSVGIKRDLPVNWSKSDGVLRDLAQTPW